MKMNDKTYDVLKWIATYLLPALGTLYFALAQIWNLPYGEQVVGSITAIDTFLGVVLGLSTSQYNKQKESELAVRRFTTASEIKKYGLNIHYTYIFDLKMA